MHYNYFRFIHKLNTIVFIILAANKSEPNFISLSPLLAEVAYLAMLSIFHKLHTASSVCHLKNK